MLRRGKRVKAILALREPMAGDGRQLLGKTPGRAYSYCRRSRSSSMRRSRSICALSRAASSSRAISSPSRAR